MRCKNNIYSRQRRIVIPSSIRRRTEKETAFHQWSFKFLCLPLDLLFPAISLTLPIIRLASCPYCPVDFEKSHFLALIAYIKVHMLWPTIVATRHNNRDTIVSIASRLYWTTEESWFDFQLSQLTCTPKYRDRL